MISQNIYILPVRNYLLDIVTTTMFRSIKKTEDIKWKEL